MSPLADLTVKILADGADLDGIKAMAAELWIKGFTTNPTLMRKAGVADYRSSRESLFTGMLPGPSRCSPRSPRRPHTSTERSAATRSTRSLTAREAGE